MSDWQPVLTELAELRRKVGHIEALVVAANIKLDGLDALLKTTQWWALCISFILAADFLATALAIRLIAVYAR